ncbi:MAG: hypothetical protein ACI9JN_000672 [Bacteroidia bacterium]|jgi:hypothetical protein
MFSFLKKKSPIDKLQKQYDGLMKDAHRLSSINRTEGDQKYTEADQIAKQIDLLLNKPE